LNKEDSVISLGYLGEGRRNEAKGAQVPFR